MRGGGEYMLCCRVEMSLLVVMAVDMSNRGGDSVG